MLLAKLDYPKYMNAVTNYVDLNGDFSKCIECGGTGFQLVMCCSGRDCTCHGLPYDFKQKCDKCGKKAPKSI
jgi:hypothetical protein